MNRPSQRGVALVITLIMLSVITVVAVAFLAISRRERATVTQKANSVDAELAADSAHTCAHTILTHSGRF